MYQIQKRFEFSASHQLEGLPDDHQCARMHGHNYIVEVGLASNALNSVGFVLDYGELKFVKEMIDTKLDHRHLNDIFAFNPTAENMANWFYYQIIDYVQERTDKTTFLVIGISETPKTWAFYDGH